MHKYELRFELGGIRFAGCNWLHGAQGIFRFGTSKRFAKTFISLSCTLSPHGQCPKGWPCKSRQGEVEAQPKP